MEENKDFIRITLKGMIFSGLGGYSNQTKLTNMEIADLACEELVNYLGNELLIIAQDGKLKVFDNDLSHYHLVPKNKTKKWYQIF